MNDLYEEIEYLPEELDDEYEYYNGTRFWYVNGQRHRADGPAVMRVDGYREWWVQGVKKASMHQ